MAMTSATLREREKKSTWRLFRMYQALIPPIKNRVYSMQANHMWEVPQGMSGENRLPQKLVETYRVPSQ